MSDIKIPVVPGMTIEPVSEEQASELVGNPAIVFLGGSVQYDPSQVGTRRVFGRELIPLQKNVASHLTGLVDMQGPHWQWYSPSGLTFIVYSEGSQCVYESWVDEDDNLHYRTWNIQDEG